MSSRSSWSRSASPPSSRCCSPAPSPIPSGACATRPTRSWTAGAGCAEDSAARAGRTRSATSPAPWSSSPAGLEAHQHALESFASDVSHELKNPLASIRSATELLAEVEDPADRERFVALVQREVARMERLLSGMREIGEIDARLETEAAGAGRSRSPSAEVVDGVRRRAGRLRIISASRPESPSSCAPRPNGSRRSLRTCSTTPSASPPPAAP